MRDGEVLRLRMEGASVFLRLEGQPATEAPPPGRPWLAIALLALSLIAALALLMFAVLPKVREQPAGVDTATATPAVTAPAATATLLSVSDQRFVPGATTVTIAQAGYRAPFFVVVHEGEAERFGRDIAHSELLPAGTHDSVEVTLPRLMRGGEYLWLMLHGDENGNGVYDGVDVDGAITDAAAGNASLANLMVSRVQVTRAASTPPASGKAALAFVTRAAPATAPTLVLAALAAAIAPGTRMLVARRCRSRTAGARVIATRG